MKNSVDAGLINDNAKQKLSEALDIRFYYKYEKQNK